MLAVSLMLNAPVLVSMPPKTVEDAMELPMPMRMEVALTTPLVSNRPAVLLLQRVTEKSPRLAVPPAMANFWLPSFWLSLMPQPARQLRVPPLRKTKLGTPATFNTLSTVIVAPLLIVMEPPREGLPLLPTLMAVVPDELVVRKNPLMLSAPPLGMLMAPAALVTVTPAPAATESVALVAMVTAVLEAPCSSITKPAALIESPLLSDNVRKLGASIGLL